MAVCSGQFGRYQAIETHPDYRRQGICTALVSTVGKHAIEAEGCRVVLLGADPKGPALGLYQSIGFSIQDMQWGLLLDGESGGTVLEAD
jgi:predicted GNAT family acetyltransferase